MTSPRGADQEALCVNVTDKATCDDTSCILMPGEHPAITKESAIAYRWAKVLPLTNLTFASIASMVELFQPLPPAILKRIQEGGLRSDFITPGNRKLIERELGEGGSKTGLKA